MCSFLDELINLCRDSNIDNLYLMLFFLSYIYIYVADKASFQGTKQLYSSCSFRVKPNLWSLTSTVSSVLS